MPADTFTTDGIGAALMGTGNDNNTWGTIANSSIVQVFADAIANILTSTVTGGTLDLSGSPPPAATSQAHYGLLSFNGTLGSNQAVKVPNLSKIWLVQNNTAGAFTLTIQTPTITTSAVIPQSSSWQWVICDGAQNVTVATINFAGAGTFIGTPAFASRIITANTTQTLALTDYAVGFNRSTPAAQICNLPGSPIAGQTIVISDLGNNFASPNYLTVTPPGGHTIAGLSTYIMAVNRGSNTFRYMGSNLWSVG